MHAVRPGWSRDRRCQDRRDQKLLLGIAGAPGQPQGSLSCRRGVPICARPDLPSLSKRCAQLAKRARAGPPASCALARPRLPREGAAATCCGAPGSGDSGPGAARPRAGLLFAPGASSRRPASITAGAPGREAGPGMRGLLKGQRAFSGLRLLARDRESRPQTPTPPPTRFFYYFFNQTSGDAAAAGPHPGTY